MRRAVLLFVLSATLLAAGMAAAVTKTCPSNCRGTAGDDVLRGTLRINVVYAEAGGDKIFGRAGDDALKGGDGRDEVYGQDGADRVKGGAGMDTLSGGSGDDLVRGDTPERPNDGARDVLECGDGTDTAYFVPGQDVVRSCEILNPPA